MPSFWTDAYREHFQTFFGKPFDVQVFHSAEGDALKLATHDWARQGFHVFASMGLADRLVRAGEEAFGEVILFSDVPDAVPARLFVNALFFLLQHDIPLDSRFAIAFGSADHSFSKQYGKTALYFTRPAYADPAFLEVPGEDGVGRVFQAFFITPEEDAFLDAQGADAFERVFREQFRDTLTDEERLDLAIDVERSQDLQARLEELQGQYSRGLSLHRPSCV